MAAPGGKPGGAAPSLSSLQAALRRGGSAPKGTATAPQQDQAAAEAPKRSLSAEDAAATLPPKKRLAAAAPDGQAGSGPVPKAHIVKVIVKTPAAKGSGLCAKVAAPGPLPADAAAVVGGESPGAVRKAGGPMHSVAKRPPATAPGASQLPAKAPAAVPDGSSTAAADANATDRGVIAIAELMGALEAAPGGAKLRHVVKLAEAMGKSLPIDHINHFLRVLKKKILERAQADGVRVQAVKAPGGARPQAPAAPAPAAAAGAAVAAAPGMATPAVPPAAGVPGARPTAPAQRPLQPPLQPAPQPQPGAVPKQPRPMAVKQPGTVTKQQPGTATKHLAAARKEPGAVSKQPGMGKQPGAVPKRPQVALTPRPPPPPQPAPQQVVPTDSTSDGATPALSPVSPGGSDLVDDPLYVLVAELSEDPVARDGEIIEARLSEVFKRLWDGVARKSRDWVAAWQAMGVPIDKQSEAVQRLLNMAFCQTADPDRAPTVIAELIKCHKVKLRVMEEVLVAFGHNLDGIMAVNEDAWHVYAKFLIQVFPQPKSSGWGWFRVGWSWTYWWQFVEKCIVTLEPARAFDVLALILRLIQDKEGQPLGQVQVWADDGRLQRVFNKLRDLGKCENSEVIERLSMQGVIVDL
mmetsp:Transcript_68998/g.166869  ORF Transcript_68998/g.166869 Transcript_68998/m.166869 type:complete len:635 (-) Transcript_68998:134-2038(-)